MFDIAIVGAGAAGLSAAIAAKRTAPQCTVAIFDAMPTVGKKILVTGNGRCNLSNVHAATHGYHNAAFAAAALQAYDAESTRQFFQSLGLYTYTDDAGRIYPLSNAAGSVLDALRLECARLDVTIFTNEKITLLRKKDEIFWLNGRYSAASVIVSTGGAAAPAHGSDGSGYTLLQAFGHTIQTPLPALVQLTSDNRIVRGWKGCRAKCNITPMVNGQPVGAYSGEILFTDYGLSGIVSMDAQRLLCDKLTQEKCAIAIDFVPTFTEAQLAESIRLIAEQDPARKCKYLLSGFVPKKIGQGLLKCLYLKDDQPCAALDDDAFSRLAKLMKQFQVYVNGAKGFDQAQVTRGGAAVAEFDAKTMQSRKTAGLYCAGELLDVDGGCGGFNLQWAFASGRCAGTSAALAVSSD